MEVMVEITKNKKPTKDREIKIPYVEGNKSEDNEINSYRKKSSDDSAATAIIFIFFKK